MVKRLSQSGLTLVELIVASVLISIILLGIVAFNASLQQMQTNSISSSSGSFQASVAMTYLRNDITMATGQGGGNNKGIVLYRSGPYSNPGNTSLCLRQPDSSPMDFTDNFWTCYLFDSTNNDLFRCVNPTPFNPIYDPVSNPSPSSFNTPEKCVGAQSSQYLAKLSDGNFFPAVYMPGDPLDITLNVIDGNSTYTLNSTITPSNHTR